MYFASDNTAGIAPKILDALADANTGFALGYGNDEWTRRVERQLAEVFEKDIAAFLVPTGTAANAVSLAHVTPPWGGVLCHEQAHIMTDECGAPEFFGAGLKLIGLPGDAGKLTCDTVAQAITRYSGHRPHQVNAATLSLTNATEAGTLYRPDEIAALAELARAKGLKVHMDGARLANALVRLNASPADLTWRSGVDVLSLGATKGGAFAAEAVIFFDRNLAEMMPERRKRAGHLLSKHRFIAAQMQAFLADGYWLALARHANAMADELARGLAAAKLRIPWPVEANLVFAVLPSSLDAKLQGAGAQYYARRKDRLPAGAMGDDEVLVRMVTSFATTSEHVKKFLALIQKG